jgi:hypothetical protein
MQQNNSVLVVRSVAGVWAKVPYRLYIHIEQQRGQCLQAKCSNEHSLKTEYETSQEGP